MAYQPTTLDHALVLLLIVVIYPLVGLKVARRLCIDSYVAILSIAATVGFGALRYFMELAEPADATVYYEAGEYGITEFSIGTQAIEFLTSLFSYGLGMNFMPTMAIYSILPLVIIPLLYATYLRLGGVVLHPFFRWSFLALMIPSAAFWGAGISKEGFALLSVAMLCWGLSKPTGRLPWLIGAVLLMILVRPHMGILMIVGLGMGYLFGRNVKIAERVLIGLLGGATLVVLLPATMDYIGIAEGSSLAELAEANEERVRLFEATSGFVDISSLSPPLRAASYLFRPLPWETGSLVQAFAAVQNVILLLFLVLFVGSYFARGADRRSFRQLVFLSYGILSLGFLAMTTANLGISARQKWMAVFPLLFMLLACFAARRQVRMKERLERKRAPLGAVQPARSLGQEP